METTKSTLKEWLEYQEEIEIIPDKHCVRVWTDKSHGFFVDVYADGHYSITDGEEEGTDIETVNEMIPIWRHGFDGSIEEFNKIMLIQ